MNRNRISLIGGIIALALIGSTAIASPAAAFHSPPMKGGDPAVVAEIATIEEECETLTGPHSHAVDLCLGLGVPVKGGGDPVWAGTARLGGTTFRYGEAIITRNITALVERCDGSREYAGTVLNVVTSDSMTGNLTGQTGQFPLGDARAVYVGASWRIYWPGGSTWYYGTGKSFDLTGSQYYGYAACK